MLRYFGSSAALTIVAVAGAAYYFGLGGAISTIILVAIEVAFSFDNAVINAKVLERLSPVWQQLFLTLGIVVAVIGMRLVFPILVVALTADLPWREVVDQALHDPLQYSRHLNDAHTSISAFGGGFLLALALYFFFDRARETLWLTPIERPLRSLGGQRWLPPLLSVGVVALAAAMSGPHASSAFLTGLLGALGYSLLQAGLAALSTFTGATGNGRYTGWAALAAFCYLEVLDASFSLDGVLGAFAITSQVIIIAVGLGVGAIWVRSLTVFFVRKGTLTDYKYLEHGAHYAILILAIALLASLFIEIPDAVTGIAGLGVILASFVASRRTLGKRFVT